MTKALSKVRQARYGGDAREIALPDGSWDLLFVRRGGGPLMVRQTPRQIARPPSA